MAVLFFFFSTDHETRGSSSSSVSDLRTPESLHQQTSSIHYPHLADTQSSPAASASQSWGHSGHLPCHSPERCQWPLLPSSPRPRCFMFSQVSPTATPPPQSKCSLCQRTACHLPPLRASDLPVYVLCRTQLLVVLIVQPTGPEIPWPEVVHPSSATSRKVPLGLSILIWSNT